MKYKVLADFTDLENGGVYRAGDTYPRAGVQPTQGRIDELSGEENRIGRPLIEAVEEPTPETPEEPKKKAKK